MLDYQQRRQMISLVYLSVFDAAPASEWQGHGGTIAQIYHKLEFTSRNDRFLIHRVLVETNICIKQGRKYDGTIGFERGRPAKLVEDGSDEQKIVANYMERGCSYTLTTIVLNIYRYQHGKVPISRSAVVNAAERMNMRETPVEKRNQGNLDPESEWARANYRQKFQ